MVKTPIPVAQKIAAIPVATSIPLAVPLHTPTTDAEKHKRYMARYTKKLVTPVTPVK
jgi:hypothetical protein